MPKNGRRQRRMSDIGTIIGEELARKKVISFERFMELALYCPNFGYYERADAQVGRKGDFFTSVSVGSLFGELLAFQFARWLADMETPKRQIVEAGSHDGQLAADILKWLREERRVLFETVEYWILEPSANRRKVQETTLREFKGKVRWFDSWEAVFESEVWGIIFANELLDAMPVRRVGWDAAERRWFEWGVTLSNGLFAWAKMAADDELETEITSWNLPAELLRVLPDGFTTEAGRAAINWWRRAARSLKGGRLVTFDYGLEQEEFFQPERRDGTLRAYRRHRLETDVLARPGEQDITAQVNFIAIRDAGSRAGLGTEYFGTQERFLMQIVEAISRAPGAEGDRIARRAREFQTLTHPEHLGRSFRVLVQGRRAE